MLNEAQFSKILKLLRNLLQAEEKLTPVEFCERYMSLSKNESDFAGRYSTALTPYVREVLNRYGDRKCKQLTLAWGSQLSKTVTMMNGSAYCLKVRQMRSTWLMPDATTAADFCDTRLKRLYESCIPLMDTIASGNRKDTWKRQFLKFQNCYMRLIGSNSPAQLASFSTPACHADEIDKTAPANTKESSAIDLLEKRMRASNDRLFAKSSTPTTLDGQIWMSLSRSNIHRFFVPCPHCREDVIYAHNPDFSCLPATNKETRLKWDGDARRDDGTWDYAKIKETAHMECPHCGGKILTRHKLEMNKRGRWEKVVDGEPGHYGYHLPAFYAPWETCSFEQFALDFIRGKNGFDGLKDYITNTIAEPDVGNFEGSGTKETPLDQVELTGEETLQMACDVQVGVIFYVIRKFDSHGDSVAIEYGKLNNLEDINPIVEQYQINKHYVAIDEGYERNAVRQFCFENDYHPFFGEPSAKFYNVTEKLKAGSKRKKEYWKRVRVDPFIGTKAAGRKKVVTYWWIGDYFRDALSKMRNKKSPIKWAIPSELLTAEVLQHLDSYYKRPKYDSKNQLAWEWVKRSKQTPDHWLDCELMLLTMAYIRGLYDKMKTE